MARIKVEDLPVEQQIEQDEMKGIFGGAFLLGSSEQKVREADSDGSLNFIGENGLGGWSYSSSPSFTERNDPPLGR